MGQGPVPEVLNAILQLTKDERPLCRAKAFTDLASGIKDVAATPDDGTAGGFTSLHLHLHRHYQQYKHWKCT